MKASNPVRCHRFVGGVAHNIACDMAALGTRSCLMSLVGQDADGDGVIAETTKRGVDLALVARSPTVKTASYTAVLEPDGELAIGLSDSQTYDQITPEFLKNHRDRLAQFKTIVVDANLPRESLQWLVDNKGSARIFAAPVSPSKALHWRQAMAGADVFIGNEREARCLTDQPAATISEALHAARTLRKTGPSIAVITLGPQGAVVSGPDLEAHFAIVKTDVVDVNGAGDAFFAGFTHALHADLPLTQAMMYGIATASLVAEHAGPVWDGLSPEHLNQRLQSVPPETRYDPP